MNQPPSSAIFKLSWRKNLLIGLGLLAFGALLKTEDVSGHYPAKYALGQASQFVSLLFFGLAAASVIRSFFGNFYSRNVAMPDPVPEPVGHAGPPKPPPLPKKKYTERDFMPPAMRTGSAADETPPPGHGAG